jgi:hypothetical protein
MRRRYSHSYEATVTAHAMLERLEALNHVRWIRPQESWQSANRRNPYHGDPKPELPIELSTSYGDWDELKDSDELTPDVYILIEYTRGSDYSGSLVEISNRKALEELCQAAGLEDGEGYIDYYGGYGTRELAIKVQALCGADDNGFLVAIVEAIEGLEDYPLLDEDLHSQLEMESQNEAWESDIRRDFQRALGKYFKSLLEDAGMDQLAEYADDCYDEWVTDQLADQWFYQLADFANEYWSNESGEGSWIDAEDVVKKGLGRTAESFERTGWKEGAAKHDALYYEILDALTRAYELDWYDGLVKQLETANVGDDGKVSASAPSVPFLKGVLGSEWRLTPIKTKTKNKKDVYL